MYLLFVIWCAYYVSSYCNDNQHNRNCSERIGDHSNEVMQDDQLAHLLSFRNVILTSHQAFFTKEALEKIAEVTLANIRSLGRLSESGNEYLENEICYQCEKYGDHNCPKTSGKNCF